ncbi:fibrinogen-like protein 1 [Saccostrea echinata]|uniref:fibrinogen-like protein 1 n=1 Tax=Saccostrea echinata TaxID=191078 RepID=UPI002A8346B3|nr:fibrinogen-like protein 1 [Saccostrea echinata]
MKVFIHLIISITISYTICVCDYNSTIWIKKRHTKEIDVLRQIINQETLIRLAVVKNVKVVVDDVSSVKLRMASTEKIVSTLQQTVESLKRQVATLSQDDSLAHKMDTLKKQIESLSQNNTLQQTVETLKKQVAILSENDTIAQKMETLKRRIDTLSQNNTLHQTVETLKKEIDFLRRDKTLQNTVESLKREVKTQRQEGRKISENCQNRFQEFDQKFKILKENMTDLYQYLNRTEVKTLEEGLKLKRDCKEHYLLGHRQSGVYTINPFGNETRVRVYCDMATKGGGWTAIQRRQSGSISFNKNWAEYKKGFGNPNGTYWIGNDVIHQLTKGNKSSLYVSITLKNGKTLYEQYQQFSISDEKNNYKLFLGGPASGSLGDRMLNTRNPNADLSGMSFTTQDRDNDRYSVYNCAAYHGGGWWFNCCHWAFLNGPWPPKYWYSPWNPTVTDSSKIKGTLMMIKPH